MGNKPSSDDDGPRSPRSPQSARSPRQPGTNLPRQPWDPPTALPQDSPPPTEEQSEGRKLSRAEKTRQKQQRQQAFQETMEVVTGLWPELDHLHNVEVKYLESEMMATLTSALGKLVHQHNHIRDLLAERHDLLQDLAEFQVDAEMQHQVLQEQKQVIAELKDDVAILSGELRRRGFAAHLPDRRASAPAEALQGQSVLETTDSPILSSGSSRHDSRRSSTKMGARDTPPGVAEKPTLMQLAAQASPRRRSGKRRSQDAGSPIVRNDGALDTAPDGPPDAFVGELQRRLSALATRRHSAKQTDMDTEVFIGRKRKPYNMMSSEQLVSRYGRLESEALTKLLGVLQIYASYAEEREKRRFLCRVMEVAFQQAGEVGQQFQQSVRALFLNPIHSASSTPDDGASCEGSRRRSSVRPTELGVSHTRAFGGTELPEHLTDQVRSYITSTAETISIAPLQEAVVSVLQEDSPGIMSATMLNNNQFDAFLGECCRLAWIMVIMTPQMYISVEKYGWRLDSKLHNILVSNPDSDPQYGSSRELQCLDYYVWPILYSKKHGEVLHKGTVVSRSERTYPN